MRERNRGHTLFELLVAGVITTLLLGCLFTIFVSMWSSEAYANDMPNAQQYAKQMAMTVADALRHAAGCNMNSTITDSNCTTDAVVESCGTSGITVYYRSAPGGTLTKNTYTVSGGTFTETPSGGSAQTIVGSPYTATLTLTYYEAETTSAYTGGATPIPHVLTSGTGAISGLTQFSSLPTSATTPDIVAIDIKATVSTNTWSGSPVTATYETFVKPRNSPAYNASIPLG